MTSLEGTDGIAAAQKHFKVHRRGPQSLSDFEVRLVCLVGLAGWCWYCFKMFQFFSKI